MATNVQFFQKYLHRFIFYEYNNPVEKKQFSIKSYLLYMLGNDTWGDEAILYGASLLWSLKVSVVFANSARVYNIRHNQNNLRKVDILVLNSGNHYSAIGTYGSHTHKNGSCGRETGRRRVKTGRPRRTQNFALVCVLSMETG